MFDICSVGKTDETEVKLKDVKFNNEGGGRYSLALTYTVEDTGEIREIHIPRVTLPLFHHSITIERSGYQYEDVFADVGFGKARLMPGDDGSYFTTKVIKTKTKEMTLQEIEKKLGHKVKIVNK